MCLGNFNKFPVAIRRNRLKMLMIVFVRPSSVENDQNNNYYLELTVLLIQNSTRENRDITINISHNHSRAMDYEGEKGFDFNFYAGHYVV